MRCVVVVTTHVLQHNAKNVTAGVLKYLDY